MKNIKIILTGLGLFVAFGFFTGCSKNDTTPVLRNITPSTLDAIPVSNFVLKQEEGQNPLVLTITWTETSFTMDGNLPVGPVSYTLEADKAGNNFANPVALAASPGLSANILTNDINSILINSFGAQADLAITIEVRVKTTFGQATQATVIPSEVVYSSNTLTLTFIPFENAAAISPVYLIGNMQGWNNGDTSFPMYRNNNNPNDGIFTYTGMFAADTYFKMCSQDNLGSWDHLFYQGDNGALLIGNSDPAFHIVNEGYYTITIDVKAMTWTLEPYDASAAPVYPIMGFVGQFCNWGDGGSDPQMSNVVAKGNNTPEATDLHNWKWSGTLNDITYGVKFRANHSWDNRWCPLVPTDNPYGISVRNPTDQDNNIDISIPGTGDYQVWFNDLTGHYIVKHK